ncbi:MAG: DUF424 family protein [Candidatus Aenigmatarchaeota archaeon]
MFHKFTKREGEKVLAVADRDLVGEVLSRDGKEFEIKESFYGREEISEEELVELSSKSTIVNAVGDRCVSVLVENDVIEEDKILEIEGVPHAQMVEF